jgi:hypothetical protein
MADDTLRHPGIDEWTESDLHNMSAKEKHDRPVIPTGLGDSEYELAKITRREYVGKAGQKRCERTVSAGWCGDEGLVDLISPTRYWNCGEAAQVGLLVRHVSDSSPMWSCRAEPYP